MTEGKIDRLYDPQVIHAWEAPFIGANIVRFLYAPAFSLLFTFLAVFPVEYARFAWLLVSLTASLAAARLSQSWSRLSFSMSVLGLLAFPAFAFSLAVGQITSVTLLIFSLIAYFEWRGEQGYKPGLLAGLALYKPQLLLPLILVWLINRRWRSIAGVIISGVLVALASIMLSWPATTEYFRLSFEFLDLAQVSTTRGANAAVFALNPWLGIGVGLGVILVLIFSSRSELMGYSQALLWLAPILTTPYIVVYDFLLLILPVSFLVPLIAKDRLVAIMIAILWVLSILAVVILNTRPITLAALGLFTVCAWRVFQRSNDIKKSSIITSSELIPPGY